MIIPTYSAFRYHFADKGSGSYNLTFADTNPDTILGGGNFIADGFVTGMRLLPAGTVSNNAYYWANTVAPGTITLIPTDAVVVEGPVAATMVGVFVDIDGYEVWPLNLVRVIGFNAGFTTTAIGISCNGGAPDAVPGVDEYNWYLSQRTDDPAKQGFIVSSAFGLSGTVLFNFNLALLGLTLGQKLTPEQRAQFYRYCHLYVQRISDGAIQWVDLLKYYIANYP